MSAERTALVTGASRGIGYAIAKRLAERGARVVMVARTRERLDAAAAEIGGTAVAADLANASAVAQLATGVVERLGDAPAILVHAAGAFELAAIEQMELDSLDAMLAINLRAPIALTRSFLPRMLQRGSGHIVSVGSVAGRTAFPGNGGYSASKFGLRGFHEVLSAELKGRGVRATLIEPAATDTALWENVDRAAHPGVPQPAQMLSADAVAQAVLFAIEQPHEVSVKYLGIERS